MSESRAKLSVRWQRERLSRIEFDTYEEAFELVAALGSYAIGNIGSEARMAKAALSTQLNFLQQLKEADQKGPVIFEIDDTNRTIVPGRLTPEGDETDLESVALIQATQQFLGDHEVEFVQRQR